MNQLEQLASEVVALLDKQRKYFDTRMPALLTECKRLEQAMREKCKEILHPEQVTGSLFPNEE